MWLEIWQLKYLPTDSVTVHAKEIVVNDTENVSTIKLKSFSSTVQEKRFLAVVES